MRGRRRRREGELGLVCKIKKTIKFKKLRKRWEEKGSFVVYRGLIISSLWKPRDNYA